jgi:dethiobiotin synthetase/adenosylmethionine--8-amino-7-oxononanoate aminotransferase
MSQVEALLHGHSYTAYPVGCAAALASLALLQDPHLNPNMCTPQVPGRCRKQTAAASSSISSSISSSSSSSSSSSDSSCSCSQPCGELLLLWDESLAAQISHHPRVAGVVVLGSVLAVELAAAGGVRGAGSYGSAAAVDVVGWLRARGVAARPLGPVVYMMATPTSSRAQCDWLMGQLREVLGQEEGVWAAAAAARAGGGDVGVLV